MDRDNELWVNGGYKHITGSHSSMHIRDWHLEVFNDWKLDDTVAVIKEFVYSGTTDNANNATRGTKDLGLKQIGCYGHKVNLVVKNARGGKSDDDG